MDFIKIFSNPQKTIEAITIISCIGLSISNFELLFQWRDFQEDKIFSWKVAKSRLATIRKGVLASFLNWSLKYPSIIYVLALRMIALFIVVLPFLNYWVKLSSFFCIIFTTLLINFRSIFGQDGSDQMLSITYGVLFLVHIEPENIPLLQLGIWFIALQACLSYSTAGIAKAFGEKWLSGIAVFMIFNTETYGHYGIASFLKQHQFINYLLTISVVIVEVFFPIVLFLPWPYFLFFLVWGILFHLLNAFIMGLNSFFWAFCATYPAIIFCNFHLQEIIYSP